MPPSDPPPSLPPDSLQEKSLDLNEGSAESAVGQDSVPAKSTELD